MRIRHFARLLASTAFVTACCAQALAQTALLSYADVLRQARNNYDVALARGTAEAAKADILTADHSPFPQLTAKLGQIDAQNGIGSSNPWQKRIDKQLGIDWTWERGNKRELRSEAARRGALAASTDVEDQQTQQAIGASAAYYDVLAAQERVELIELNAASAADLAGISRRRFQAGDIARIETTRLEIEAERARSDVRSAALDRQRAALALATSIGAAHESLTVQPDWPPMIQFAMAKADMAVWVDQRADVRAATERIAAAQAQVESAAALKKADVTLGASVDSFPGVSTLFFELRMVVPLEVGYHYEGETGRALAQLNQARDLLEKTRLAARIELERLRAEADTASQRWQAYQTQVLPRASEVAAQAELAYRKGGIGLNDLLDARRTARATQLEAIAAHADYAKAASTWRLRTAGGDKSPWE